MTRMASGSTHPEQPSVVVEGAGADSRPFPDDYRVLESDPYETPFRTKPMVTTSDTFAGQRVRNPRFLPPPAAGGQVSSGGSETTSQFDELR